MNLRMNGKNLMKFHYRKNKSFYSNLNMEDITDSDYNHVKIIFRGFERKKLHEYHDLNILKFVK